MPNHVAQECADIKQKIDVIIVATKSLPGQNIPEKIKEAVSDDTAILLLQNGMFIENEFQAAFPHNTIIRGLAFVCVSKPSPGHVFHQDYGRIVIGKYPEGHSEAVRILAEKFNESGVLCKVDETIQKSSWRKLIWNAPFNPISVINGGVNTQEMLGDPTSKALVVNVMKEVCKLANEEGYDLGQADIDRNIENTLTMHPYKTSMLLDYENKREMEIDAILGNAIAFAKSRKVDVPYMQSLFEKLTQVQLKSEATQ